MTPKGEDEEEEKDQGFRENRVLPTPSVFPSYNPRDSQCFRPCSMLGERWQKLISSSNKPIMRLQKRQAKLFPRNGPSIWITHFFFFAPAHKSSNFSAHWIGIISSECWAFFGFPPPPPPGNKQNDKSQDNFPTRYREWNQLICMHNLLRYSRKYNFQEDTLKGKGKNSQFCQAIFPPRLSF